MFARLDGAQIPGGCDWCDAYQEPSILGPGVVMLAIRHDAWCRWFNRRKEAS